jgi:hypothetical protein
LGTLPIDHALINVREIGDSAWTGAVRSSLYCSKGRLYLADAAAFAARGDKDMTIASRHDQTIRFAASGRAKRRLTTSARFALPNLRH